MVKIINSILLALSLLSCGSIYLFLFGGELLILMMLFFALTSLILQKQYSKVLLTNFTISIALILTVLLFNWIVTGFNLAYTEYPKYILRCIVVNLSLLALYNLKKLTYKDFIWLFNLVLVHATLNFIFGFIFKSYFILVSSPEGIQSSSLGYVFFYMANINVGGIDVYRNQSFFWEPGVLSFILNIYLFILLFGNNNIKKQGKLIPLVCFLILTTFSTTGIGLMMVQFGFYLFKDNLSVKKILLSTICLISLLPIFISNVDEKNSRSGENSSVIRYYDSLIALDIIYNNPSFGIGLSSIKYNLEQTKYPRFFQMELMEGKPSSNSVLSTFATLGIPLALLMLYGLYKQEIIPFKRKVIFGIFLILLASEPLMFSSFFLLFIFSSFYVMEERNVKSLEKQPIISNE